MGGVQVTYPGVYIQEIPSGTHTIVGVATSITAFLGRAISGPTDEPMTIFSFGDYQRFYGGLGFAYPMSYAVRDFFLNGGSQAIIVRLADAAAAAATADGGSGLSFTAANVGSWASPQASTTPKAGAAPSGLSVWLDALEGDANLTKLGVQTAGRFNLTVSYQPTGGAATLERFQNVSLSGDADPRRIDRILAAESNFVRATIPSAAAPNAGKPTTGKWIAFTGGTDSGHLTDATVYKGDSNRRTGMFQLEKVDLFNILCIPPDQRGGDTDLSVYQQAAEYCQKRRAMLIIDPLVAWTDHFKQGNIPQIQPTDLEINGDVARNATVYFPRVVEEDDMMKGQEDVFPASGIIAGIYAATDVARGVWKAPAGIEAGLNGIVRLDVKVTDPQNGLMNPLGINCLREFPVIGPVVWGARTLRGADILEDDYKYIPVRRLTLYIEESLYRGTQWAVFKPNDERLWSALRLSVGTFMADLSRQGAFYSYQVVCDQTTTTQSDIDKGIVRILVAFAPVKPAEFVIIEIQQQAGQVPA
jgi:phage tail sheath protein FI